MTIASTTIKYRSARPSGVNRLALTVGLALVAWGRRTPTKRVLSFDEMRERREAELRADQLRSNYGSHHLLAGPR